MDFTDYGCVVVVVMTHGYLDEFLMAKDKEYLEQEILDCFKGREKSSLFTKPVVLIIEACRGDGDSKAADVGRKSSESKNDLNDVEGSKSEVDHYNLQVEPDTIVLHSSSVRKPSFRKEDGTWFIKALCNAINALSVTQHLESIMTEVKRKVAIDDYQSCMNEKTNKCLKQMPVSNSGLVRKLYLRKFGEEPPIIECAEIGNLASLPYPPGPSPAQIWMRYQYMRKILLLIHAQNKADTETEFLLQKSMLNDTNCDTNSMQLTLLAMNYYIKERFRNTPQQDYILYYEIV